MPAYDSISRSGIARSPRHTRGTSASTATTISIRHHTSGSAGSEISLPKMAVKPHSSTQKWICRKALLRSVIGMRGIIARGHGWRRRVHGADGHAKLRRTFPEAAMEATVTGMRSNGRRFAAVVALVSAASLLLQYGLLIRITFDTIGPMFATVRYFSYFTILSNLLVTAVAVVAMSGDVGAAG